jgi:phage terminase large subunit-like protein
MSLDPKIAAILEELTAADNRKTYRAKDFFEPYTKQQEFCDMGSYKRRRLLSAGNQTGKTEVGAYECACHLTGEYPDWWLGRRWDRPVKAWAAGITGLSTRNVVQKKLCGEPGVEAAFGSGMIPRELFVGRPSLARGVSGLYDKIVVKHKSGGDSVLILMSYEQGREKWQGDTLDFLWFDEEPPKDIWSEGLARLTEGGMAYMTFTPLNGMTDVVIDFFQNPVPDMGLVQMTLDDVAHFSKEEKALRIAGYRPHEREAREKGVPMLGEGKVFQIPEDFIREPALTSFPAHWTWLWGIDFGIQHPFAAVLGAWDKDTDTIHIVHSIRMSDAMIIQHVRAMKAIDKTAGIRVAWPQDGTQRDRGSLTPMSKLYAKEGLRMLHEHAKFADGSNSTETGIMEMDERMKTGRLKVAAHLSEWFDEFRNYHRKDGLLVKVRDDLLSATRVLVMAKRFSGVLVDPFRSNASRAPTMAKGLDDDPWGR